MTTKKAALEAYYRIKGLCSVDLDALRDLETIRAALEAPDLAEVVRDFEWLMDNCANWNIRTRAIKTFREKHAAAIAWAKEQGK